MNTDLMFSSKTDLWATPQDFFNKLNEEFNFNLDPCADETNHKCKKYFTKEIDGLKQDWQGHKVFVNPPYGRALKDWIKKAAEEGQKENTTVVMLIPARPDTIYFHSYIWDAEKEQPRPGVKVRFLKGRLKFGDSKDAAPFPSMIVIFDKGAIHE